MNDVAAGVLIEHAECGACRLELVVDDPLIVPELFAHPPGAERDHFAVTALRIGVLALKQAQGRLDADAIRGEGERLLATLEERLGNHQRGVQEQVASTLREYFDPASGRFNERVEQLVKSGGELDRVLRAQVGATDSELAKTLAAHVGEQSTLMKILRPSETEGILSSLSGVIQKALETQRNTLLAEFSLDNGGGALARLVKELTTTHGELAKALGELIQKGNRENDEFRAQVRESLAALQARREESQKSTRHGLEFEQSVLEFVANAARGAGDRVDHVGHSTGLIKNCKTGDVVLTLGPEHAAAGARIVFEAKQHASYGIAKALEEIEEARKNRDAGVGVFVFSRRTLSTALVTAPVLNLAPLSRYGNDIVVVWDSEDPASDVVLSAALSVARALAVRADAERKSIEIDCERMQKAMLDIEKQAQGLDEIRRNAQSIRRCADGIEDRAGLMAKNIGRAADVLNEEIEALRAVS